MAYSFITDTDDTKAHDYQKDGMSTHKFELELLIWVKLKQPHLSPNHPNAANEAR